MIAGCIYRHPHTGLNEFKSYYANDLLDKLPKENKTVFLWGDFNIDLLNFHQHWPTNEFVDSFSLFSLIIQPKRIRNKFKTPIDNNYSNMITPNKISGNLTAQVSDDIPKFVIAPNILSNPSSTELSIFERDWSKSIK